MGKLLPPGEREYLAAKRGRIDAALTEIEEARRAGTLSSCARWGHLLTALPPFEEQPAEFQALWGNGNGGYDVGIVAPYVVIVEEATNRKEFERLCGMYASGYRTRRRAAWYSLRARSDVSLAVLRRETRRLYGEVKARLLENPPRSPI